MSSSWLSSRTVIRARLLQRYPRRWVVVRPSESCNGAAIALFHRHASTSSSIQATVGFNAVAAAPSNTYGLWFRLTGSDHMHTKHRQLHMRPVNSPHRPGSLPHDKGDSPGRPANSHTKQWQLPGRQVNSPRRPGSPPHDKGDTPGRKARSPANNWQLPGRQVNSPGRPGSHPHDKGDLPGRKASSPANNWQLHIGEWA